jgi:hypothetical protein
MNRKRVGRRKEGKSMRYKVSRDKVGEGKKTINH